MADTHHHLPDPPHRQPVPLDTHAARELREAIVVTRRRLLDVLYARARTLATIGTWAGPHRVRYDEDAAELLAAGRALDHSLAGLLTAIDAELAAADHR